MNAQDLRIENYYKWYSEGNEYIYQVEAKDFTSDNIKNFDPIPLTEEWLLKFGFKRHDVGSVSAQFSYGVNPVTQDYLLYLVWIKDYEADYELKDFPFFLNGHFEIRTVHQLQNLFYALTGEELICNHH